MAERSGCQRGPISYILPFTSISSFLTDVGYFFALDIENEAIF